MADINVDLGDIRGLKGDPGQDGQDGQDGQGGVRGSLWYTGTALTHTSGSAATETGITGALAGDMYLNTESSNVYQCTTGGDSGEAVWLFLQTIRGANGNGSLVASTASDGYTDVTFTDAEGEETTFRAGNSRPTGSTSMSGGLISSSITKTIRKNAVSGRGDMAFVEVDVANFSLDYTWTGGDDNIIAVIPEGYRPPATIYASGIAQIGGANRIVLYSIQADGSIRARLKPTGVTGTTSAVIILASYMRA